MNIAPKSRHEEDKLESVGRLVADSKIRDLEGWQNTLLHNMVEAAKDSTYWTPLTIAQAFIGLWFAASHQPWIVGIASSENSERG